MDDTITVGVCDRDTGSFVFETECPTHQLADQLAEDCESTYDPEQYQVYKVFAVTEE